MVKIRIWEGRIEDMDKITELIESGKCFNALNFWYAAYIIYNCASNSSSGVVFEYSSRECVHSILYKWNIIGIIVWHTFFLRDKSK